MKINLLIMLSLFTSCSTLKKNMFAFGLSSAAIGAVGGSIFSPEVESKDKNSFLFGLIAGAIGAGIGYLTYETPAHKKNQTPMLLEDNKETQLPLFEFSPDLKDIKPEVNFKPIKKYEVPLEKLPRELEGKVKKQYIIEYESKAQTLDLGNRTLQISPFKAWEHVYEK